MQLLLHFIGAVYLCYLSCREKPQPAYLMPITQHFEFIANLDSLYPPKGSQVLKIWISFKYQY